VKLLRRPKPAPEPTDPAPVPAVTRAMLVRAGACRRALQVFDWVCLREGTVGSIVPTRELALTYVDEFDWIWAGIKLCDLPDSVTPSGRRITSYLSQRQVRNYLIELSGELIEMDYYQRMAIGFVVAWERFGPRPEVLPARPWARVVLRAFLRDVKEVFTR
jgi:hypothetical protein